MTAAEPHRPPLIESLARPGVLPDARAPVRILETHISWVLLTDGHAYKIKKPVELPFLDFRELAERKRLCEEELRLNRRLAPGWYLDVVPIGGTPEMPQVGAMPAIEYAVRMRRFPDGARLDEALAAGAVSAEAIAAFGARLAEFHASLPGLPNVLAPRAEAAIVTRAAEDNLRDLAPRLAGSALEMPLARLAAWTKERNAAVQGLLAARLEGSAQRDCHGDLHLANLMLVDGEIVAFDALEFDPRLREIDVASEAAFTAMDLMAHDRTDLAYVFLTRYLETGGDYDGVAVLRYYLVYRALIRAKVSALAGERPDLAAVAPYVEIAAALLAPRRPLLTITHGLSGSGKTHLTNELLGPLGALRARSDLERKRLHGLSAGASSHSPVGGGLYDATSTEATYGRLAAVASLCLREGFDTIVDAAFLARAERARFRALAHDAGAGFAILHCTAPPAVLRARIAARAARPGEVSEAKQEVLEYQLAHAEALTAEEQALAVTVDTDEVLDRAELGAALRAHGLKPSGKPPDRGHPP